jgi:hypothetical protein
MKSKSLLQVSGTALLSMLYAVLMLFGLDLFRPEDIGFGKTLTQHLPLQHALHASGYAGLTHGAPTALVYGRTRFAFARDQSQKEKVRFEAGLCR